MSLTFNIHQPAKKPLELKGELTAPELAWETRDDMIRVSQPLQYALEIEQLDNGFLVRGSLRQVLDCVCVRCLKAYHHEVRLEPWTCLLELTGEERVTVVNDCVDLTPYIREDIFLAFPQHPLCGPQCEGLALSQKDERPDVSWEAGAASSAWAELDKLKLD